MSFKALLLAIASATAPLAACYVEAPAPVVYAHTASLAYVSPGVEVVTGWSHPAFFADGWYWHFDGGVWYRAAELGGPRVRVDVVPPALARLPHPELYVHYTPARTLAIRPAPRVHWRVR